MTTHPAEPVSWPDGRRAAASFTFDVDAESALLGVDTALAGRMSVMSHQAYGPLVGVPRILALLARHDVRSTFFVPGYTAVRYPDVVRAIADAGHEIAHHGYLHEVLTGMTPEQEGVVIDRGIEALSAVTGTAPAGFRAPMWELNWHTPNLLAERGFLYDTSLMDADHPYELAVAGGGQLVEIPIQWALDDWEQYCYIPDISGSGLIESPRKAAEIWRLEFEGLRSAGGCFVLTNHPFLSGRPSRAAALEELVEYVASCSDVWLAPLHEIATHVRGLALPPRSIVRPDPAQF
ncbi:polysaccharide deacetylase family protein [Mycolicibacterium brisbanense]|uniref:Polysaccharide deacetylase n=1 Tax=Mycolicibacterium brisbanense TaxID=146020 RepID=A0A100VY39_9MYCO|nr:polysaccharide deacetylase [Mycolicibacterium brisbanense]MCV7160962.1 polysaccharide deacetylase [Mycolicibacterium brisbanense]GAS88141.1 polysaccharide deacetylase [Mycolicibacterium brisbanense]